MQVTASGGCAISRWAPLDRQDKCPPGRLSHLPILLSGIQLLETGAADCLDLRRPFVRLFEL